MNHMVTALADSKPLSTQIPRPWTSGKHLLITGASGGIGRELALRLMGVCSQLTLISRNRHGTLAMLETELMEYQQKCVDIGNLPTRLLVRAVDVRDSRAASEIIHQIYLEDGGQVDGFVNCAGGSHTFTLFETMNNEDIDEILDINAKAPMYWLKELLPLMKGNRLEQPDLKRAHVLMLSSRSGERPLANLSVYAAAKGCVEKFVEAMRTEYARKQIAFTVVNPGSINTRFTQYWPEQLQQSHNSQSMTAGEAISPIMAALNSQFATNRISYESVAQWQSEPGVLGWDGNE